MTPPAVVLAHAPGALGWLLPLAAVAVAALALAGLRNRPQRPDRPGLRTTDRRRAAALVAAAATMAVVTSPPFERLAEGRFALHMVQHLTLVSVVAPLVALSRPATLLLAGAGLRVADLPDAPRRLGHRARPLTGSAAAVVAAALVMSAVLWAWHVPALFDAAVGSPAVHALEHATMFGTALWFWFALVARRTPAHAALLAVLVAAVLHGALGGLLTFAPRPLYGPDSVAGLADQQLAGLLMWVPGGIIHLVAAAALVAAMLAGAQRRASLRTPAAAR